MTTRHSAIISTLRRARSLRGWVCGVVLLSMLFTQLAMAAYVCPAMRVSDRQANDEMAAMPCAGSMADGAMHGMDPDQAALCFEHCKPAAQTVDAGHAAALAEPALFALIVLGAGDEGDESPSWTAHARARDRAPPAAHSIVHCCLRI